MPKSVNRWTSGRSPQSETDGGSCRQVGRVRAGGEPDARQKLRAGTAREGFERGAVRHDHADEEAAGAAIPQRVVIDLHFLAGLDGRAVPLVPAGFGSDSCLRAPTPALFRPARDLHPQEGVRLRPFELVDGAFELLFLPHSNIAMSSDAPGRWPRALRGEHRGDRRDHGARLQETRIPTSLNYSPGVRSRLKPGLPFSVQLVAIVLGTDVLVMTPVPVAHIARGGRVRLP